MTNILKQEEFSELLHEHGKTPEIQALVEEFFMPEMMSKEIGSSDVLEHFERIDLLLITLDKDESIKRGAIKVQ